LNTAAVTIQPMAATAERLEADGGLRRGAHEPCAPPREGARQGTAEATWVDALAEMEALLARQELLLREADHRVRNSLQLVSSALRLQGMRKGADPRLREEFAQASRRIEAVARTHERLHRPGAAGEIEFAGYLRGLCADLAAALAHPAIEVDAADSPVAADKAVSLGLVANELVTNACKHARLDGAPGRVRVGLSRLGDGTLRLSVADEGAGLPEGFDPARSAGLGMRIIHGLARALGARLEVDPGPPGARFAVLLPAADGSRSPCA
jgi:two-component sensor histidine kinase